jgi:hypothetical protein
MNARSKITRQRIWSLLAILGLAGLATLVTPPGLWADGSSGVDVYRVEEDWQLVVNEPDPTDNGPQVTCTISPADMDTAYCAFDLNYHTQPDYVAGGMQIHTWDPLDPVEYSNAADSGVMATPGETVTWTQAMTWKNSTINFQVSNGQSQTWGTFGGHSDSEEGQLFLSLPTSLSNLNSYSPDVSLNNSGVSFASNLVGSLTLVAVRWYDANGNLIKEITTPQNVHPQN